MAGNSDDILGQVMGRSGPRLVVDNEKPGYQAWDEDRSGRAERLFIHYMAAKPQLVGSFPISHMGEVYSPDHKRIIIAFSNSALVIRGRNLTKLVEMLDAGKVRALRHFHPDQYQEPDDGEPLITSIRRESMAAALGGGDG